MSGFNLAVVGIEKPERGVTRLGGGIDESPQAYRDIETVIAAQDELIEVIGRFTRQIARMAEEASEY